MIFQEVFQTRLSDYDRNGQLTFEAALQLLEYVSGHHSDSVNDNVLAGSRNGIAWIVADWRVRIVRSPGSGEKLTGKTWIRSPHSSLILLRDFSVEDGSGSPVILGEVRLCLVDLKTAHPVRIPDALCEAYQPEERAVFPDKLPRLRPPGEGYSEVPLPAPLRADIDFNGHLHNTRYMALALQCLPEKAFREQSFTAFRIQYSLPVKEGDRLTARVSGTDEGYILGFFRGKELCTTVELCRQ